MLKLTHRTTDREIESATRDELYAVLNGKYTNPRKLSKTELVNCAKLDRDAAKQEHATQQAEAEAARLATIAAEKAEGKVAKILDAVVRGLDAVLDSHRQTIAKFHAAMQQPVDKIHFGHAIVRYGQDLMDASQTMDALLPVRNCLAKQVVEPTFTMEQTLGYLRDDLKQAQRDLLRDGYRHSSTSALDNVNNMCQFRALQTKVVVLQQVVAAITDDMATPLGGDLGRGAFLTSFAY